MLARRENIDYAIRERRPPDKHPDLPRTVYSSKRYENTKELPGGGTIWTRPFMERFNEQEISSAAGRSQFSRGDLETTAKLHPRKVGIPLKGGRVRMANQPSRDWLQEETSSEYTPILKDCLRQPLPFLQNAFQQQLRMSQTWVCATSLHIQSNPLGQEDGQRFQGVSFFFALSSRRAE